MAAELVSRTVFPEEVVALTDRLGHRKPICISLRFTLGNKRGVSLCRGLLPVIGKEKYYFTKLRRLLSIP
jgi:hypothetical protein